MPFLRKRIDQQCHLHQALPSSKPMELIVQRGSSQLPMKFLPDKNPPLEPIDAENVEPGLEYTFYHGSFHLLPDFSELDSDRGGVVPELDLDEIRGDRDADFAVVLDGLIKVQLGGLYRMTITSDDGGCVYLHGDQFIDNDGNHPPMPASRLLRAKAGLHPIRIEYFQGTGQKVIELKLERFNEKSDEQPKIKFFYAK